MTEMYNHDYIFHITEKAIHETLYNIGTVRDGYTDGITDTALTKDSFWTEPIFIFFKYVGLLQPDNYILSKAGKELFEQYFIFKDELTADNKMSQLLLRNPVVNLLCQTFYGRGKIDIEQLKTLLNFHHIGSQEIVHSDVVSLLILLNGYGIVVYDKKNKVFYVKEIGAFSEPVSQYYINPDTPFSNIYNMRKIIRSCRGKIFWIDKHFRKEGFEMLYDGLSFEGVKSVTIISGTDNLTSSARSDYFALQMELSKREIVLDWRIISDTSFKWHDRWLVADNQCHNIPPVLAIIRGQRSEILLIKERLDVESFMVKSIPISS